MRVHLLARLELKRAEIVRKPLIATGPLGKSFVPCTVPIDKDPEERTRMNVATRRRASSTRNCLSHASEDIPGILCRPAETLVLSPCKYARNTENALMSSKKQRRTKIGGWMSELVASNNPRLLGVLNTFAAGTLIVHAFIHALLHNPQAISYAFLRHATSLYVLFPLFGAILLGPSKIASPRQDLARAPRRTFRIW